MQATGAFAWLGLWQFRRDSRPAKWILPAVLFFSVVAAATLALTGTTGGEIRHLEIRPNKKRHRLWQRQGLVIHATTTQRIVLRPSRWGGTWPIWSFHFLGLALLFERWGCLISAYSDSSNNYRFVLWSGLSPGRSPGSVCNLVTGMLFYRHAPLLQLQHRLSFENVRSRSAGVNILLLFCTDAFRECEQLGPNEDAPISARFLARPHR